MASVKELFEISVEKGYAVSRYKPGIYQYSKDGYNWTRVKCTWSQFVKIVKNLPPAK